MENSLNPSNSLSHKNIHIGSGKRLTPGDIVLLLASVNYTEIHFANGHKIMVATTLKTLEKRFSISGDFFRTHKSSLINLNYIKAYDNLVTDDYVEMKNDFKIAISRRRKLAFEQRMREIAP
jgi:two-component system, LytTR family, response regulator